MGRVCGDCPGGTRSFNLPSPRGNCTLFFSAIPSPPQVYLIELNQPQGDKSICSRQNISKTQQLSPRASGVSCFFRVCGTQNCGLPIIVQVPLDEAGTHPLGVFHRRNSVPSPSYQPHSQGGTLSISGFEGSSSSSMAIQSSMLTTSRLITNKYQLHISQHFNLCFGNSVLKLFQMGIFFKSNNIDHNKE